MAHEISYICELSEGIHARSAGLIARVCGGDHAEIMWQNMQTGLVGIAKSALSLIATDTLQGDYCRIRSAIQSTVTAIEFASMIYFYTQLLS
ncbi:HPr family phosphocarrier protein [Citrobacter portucalensis]|uniref:HPr family phosphocarrier protein n=1 Tax=Citrobacter portucalensis TaxID=1639133 RepID=A0AAW5WAW9_9ENTR|nr:HPr family phosphocarrier protein [Citrobacter portucalensis]MCX9004404.1 HPr family phosphocarrier protein [Citrobacter portucalensis]